MRILFFAPHSALWVHAFPEALVAEALQQGGHEIVYVTCGRLFAAHCVAMNAAGVRIDAADADKQKVCDRCDAHKRLIRNKFGFQGYDLADKVTPEDRRTARQLAVEVSRDGFLDFEMGGIAIGRIALYEFLLNRKKSSLDFDDLEWSHFRQYLENSLLCFFGARRVLDAERPQRLVVYNSLYSVNRVMCELAEARGIPTYFLHAGHNLSNRLQTLLVGRRNGFEYYRYMIAAWPEFKDRPCDAALMHRIGDHFMVLFRGQSVFGYSAASEALTQSIRQRFSVAAGQRIVVATMSSYDERFAAEAVGVITVTHDLPFPRQVDWINALKDYVVGRPDLFLIVRVHPREFPNRREQVKSEHARFLEAALTDLPENVAVNWPTDNISLYDLVNETSVFLNAWSAVGKEMSLLGVPVVIHAPELVAYPADLNYCATTREGYFRQIERALDEGWSVERSRMTFRWLAMEYGYGLIDIGDGYRQSEFPSRSFVQRATRRLLRIFDPLYVARRDCARRPDHLAAATTINSIFENLHHTPLSVEVPGTRASIEEETRALRIELGRIAGMISDVGAPAGIPLAKDRLTAFVDKGVSR